ncbi:MAG: carboxypeptidase-like regulatory domain-containing protein [Bacteroidota bacterium]
MKKTHLLLLLSLLLFSACRKDVDDLVITTEEDPPIVLIRSSIRGKVIDEDGSPLGNVEVQVGNEMLLSDNDGNFKFEQVEVKKSGTIVKANANGFFSGSTHSYFTADGSSYVEIRLMKKGAPKIVQSNDGGTIITSDGLEITFPPKVITYENGSDYSGPIEVYSRWLDPTDPEVAGVMPGALIATDENGVPLALATYGMAVIELETPGGTKLEVSEGETLDLKMPIPADLQNDAPAEIPLWYFDLEEEEWLLSSKCQKDGSYYIGKITSTGFWNCDVALPAICLSGQVFSSDSSYACYLKVIVEDLTDNFIYWGYTDSVGFFCGAVPQAAPLRIYIKDLCDSIIYTADIGPFSQDFELDDIYLDETVQTFLLNITGSVMHCLSNDVPIGHVAISYPGKISIFPFQGGGYNIDLALKCVQFPNLNITAYSRSQPNSTITVNHNDTTDLDMGLLATCEDLDDYFNLTVDGMNYWTAPTRYFLKNNTTSDWMVLEGLSGGGKFILDLRDYQGVGTYNSNVFFQTQNDFSGQFYPLLNTASPDINLEITEDNGTFIIGNFSGTAPNGSGGTYDLIGDFKIKKAP